MKFKVGDKVIGKPSASDKYKITVEGWIGTVIEVSRRSSSIKVRGLDLAGKPNSWHVDGQLFDLLQEPPQPAPSTDEYDLGWKACLF